MNLTKIRKDMRRRRIISRREVKRLVLLYLLQDLRLPWIRRFVLRQSVLQARNYNTLSVTKIHNRCVLSGRSRSIISKFRLSRIMVRKLAAIGYLVGVVKASW